MSIKRYKLFHNMGYKSIKGLWQLTIVVDNSFGYIGCSDEQHDNITKLQREGLPPQAIYNNEVWIVWDEEKGVVDAELKK